MDGYVGLGEQDIVVEGLFGGRVVEGVGSWATLHCGLVELHL